MSEKKRTKEYLALFDALVKPKKREPAHPLPDVGEVEWELNDDDNPQFWLGHLRAKNRTPSCKVLDSETEGYIELALDSSERLIQERRRFLALIASLKGKHAETRGLVRDLTTCLETRNKEIASLKADVERLAGERDVWRRLAVENSATLEVIRLSHEDKPFKELCPELIKSVTEQTDKTRAKLGELKERHG